MGLGQAMIFTQYFGLDWDERWYSIGTSTFFIPLGDCYCGWI